MQFIPHVVDTAELRTNIGINNVSDNLASVMVRLISQQGTELGAMSVIVMPRGMTQLNQVVRQLLNRGEMTNVEGYVRLESSQPILAWASQIDNGTYDPGLAVSKGVGASKLLVQSTANVGNFKSSLVVVNLGDGGGCRRFSRSQHPRNGSGRAKRASDSAERVRQLCQRSGEAGSLQQFRSGGDSIDQRATAAGDLASLQPLRHQRLF